MSNTATSSSNTKRNELQLQLQTLNVLESELKSLKSNAVSSLWTSSNLLSSCLRPLTVLFFLHSP